MPIAAGTFETLLLVELRLGLPPLFCWRLAEIKDDWAFTPLENTPSKYVLAISKLLGNRKPKHPLKTLRELCLYVSPKSSIWNSGVFALDMLSLHFHFEITGDSILSEPDIEAKLQDLLLDPEVIAFEKKWANRFGGNKSDE